MDGDLAANQLVVRDATRAPNEIFGLSPDWPRPADPFDD
jgi:hypothetical protein